MFPTSGSSGTNPDTSVLTESETEQASRDEPIGCASFCQPIGGLFERLRELNVGLWQPRSTLPQASLSEALSSVHPPRATELESTAIHEPEEPIGLPPSTSQLTDPHIVSPSQEATIPLSYLAHDVTSSNEPLNCGESLHKLKEAKSRLLRHRDGLGLAKPEAEGELGLYERLSLLSQWDSHHLPYFVEAENAKNPELNLHHFKNINELAAYLQENANKATHGRAIVNLDNRDGNSLHHIALDIHTTETGRASIIAIDSTDVPWALPGLSSFIKTRPNIVGSIIITKVQKSLPDCMIFSLSFAKKMHDEKEKFLLWHNQQLSGKPLGNPQITKSNFWQAWLLSELSSFVGEITDCPNFGLVEKEKAFEEGMLTERFLRHATSKKTLETVKAKRPNAEQEEWDKLLERYNRHETTRYDSEKEKNLVYSTSIEAKRRTFIQSALEYYQAKINLLESTRRYELESTHGYDQGEKDLSEFYELIGMKPPSFS